MYRHSTFHSPDSYVRGTSDETCNATDEYQMLVATLTLWMDTMSDRDAPLNPNPCQLYTRYQVQRYNRSRWSERRRSMILVPAVLHTAAVRVLLLVCCCGTIVRDTCGTAVHHS